MNAVATPARPKAKKAPAPGENRSHVTAALADALESARQADSGAPDTCGDATRLLRLAATIAADLHSHSPKNADQDHYESTGYDLAALVKMAMLVPDDVASLARRKAIEEAGREIVILTDDPKAMRFSTRSPDGIQCDFLKGKALAALMVREASAEEPSARADLHASYREPGQAQHNIVKAMIEQLLANPRLLDGFSAALASMLAEGMDGYSDISESAATLTYRACTVYEELTDGSMAYSGPSLDQQIAEFGLVDLVPNGLHDTTVAAVPVKAQKAFNAVTTKKYSLPAAQHQSIYVRLDNAEAILNMLVHVFGGDADTDEPAKTPGLHGSLQHVKWVLAELHLEIMGEQIDLPDDLRWRTFEASELSDLAEHLAFNNQFKFDRWSDGWTCSYFDAVLNAVKIAKASMDQVEASYA